MSVKATRWVRTLDKTGLNTSDVCVLYVLADHQNASSEKCYPSKKTIKEIACMTDNTVRKVIQNLEARGLIKRVPQFEKSGRQTSNLYCLSIEAPPSKIAPLPQGATPAKIEGGEPPNDCAPMKGYKEDLPPKAPTPVFEDFWNPLSRPGDNFDSTKAKFSSLTVSEQRQAIEGAKTAAQLVKRKTVRRRAPVKMLELRYWQHPDYKIHLDSQRRFDAMQPIARYSRIWWAIFWNRVADRKPVAGMIDRAAKATTEPYRVDPDELPADEQQQRLVKITDLSQIDEYRAELRRIGDDRRIPYTLPSYGSNVTFYMPDMTGAEFVDRVRKGEQI